MINKFDSTYLKSINSKVINKNISNEKNKLKEKTEEFEAIFIKMMLDSMDKTIDKKDNPFYGGDAEDIFNDMLNTNRSKEMATSGGLGIAKMLYDQLSKGIK